MPGSTSGLRFDKVVVRLLGRLRAFCQPALPPGTTVVVTVTAPIRLAAKTAAAIEALIARDVTRGRLRDRQATIHGNRVRMRILAGGPDRVSRFIGFVHNPESSAGQLIDIASEVFELVKAGSGRRTRRTTGEGQPRAVSAGASSWLDAYRDAYAQLQPAGDSGTVVIVFRDGTGATLSRQSVCHKHVARHPHVGS